MKKILMTVMIVGCIGLLFFPGCKKSDETGTTQYTLTVTTNDGVSGTPTAGTHTYDENAVVSYNYSVGSGYKGLTVTLDGATVAASGNITMTGNHTLVATAESYDIRGNWTGKVWVFGTSDFKCRFSGDVISGATSGYIPGLGPYWEDGEFTVTNGNELEFNLEWGDPADREAVFTATLTSENRIEGEWKWYFNGVYQVAGGWELTKE